MDIGAPDASEPPAPPAAAEDTEDTQAPPGAPESAPAGSSTMRPRLVALFSRGKTIAPVAQGSRQQSTLGGRGGTSVGDITNSKGVNFGDRGTVIVTEAPNSPVTYNAGASKRFISILFLSLPFLALIAVVLYWWIPRARAPSVMTGIYRVAIADFGLQDQQGVVRASQDGRDLSYYEFGEVKTELQKSFGDDVQIWHDSLGARDKKGKIGIIQGATPQARADAAAALAGKIRADLVIYGNLTSGQPAANFTPEFFVASEDKTQRTDAGDITGSHQLGAPISVHLPLNFAGRKDVPEQVAIRTSVLTLFTKGLFEEFSGDPSTALSFFQQAEQMPGWKDDEGKEIVYLFIGREYLQLQPRDLDRARTAFNRALAIRPDFARAYVGKGNVSYFEAYGLLRLDSPPQDAIDQAIPSLQEALLGYSQALSRLPDVDAPLVEAKARNGLGETYLLQGYATLKRDQLYGGEHRDEAIRLFDRAVDEANRIITIGGGGQARQLVEAYKILGASYQQEGYALLPVDRNRSNSFFALAINGFSRCIEHADALPQDSFASMLKSAYCVPLRDDAARALASAAGPQREARMPNRQKGDGHRVGSQGQSGDRYARTSEMYRGLLS